MGVNKVYLANGETLLDLTGVTVTPQTLVKGVTAIDSKGEPIVGLLVPEGGGTGSGIIDVTELPTENIDENAVYRLTESIQTEKTEVYLIVYLNGNFTTLTLQQYLASIGVPTIPHIYVVDELSNMLETDVQTFSTIHIYILKSDGIAYAYAPAYGGIITMGLFGFQAMGYDKGFTENIYDETELGVYTTIENIKEVVRYFIRENGEWKDINAYVTFALSNGFNNIEVLSGDITSIAYSASDILSRNYKKIKEEWFLNKDGTYVNKIVEYAFVYSSLKTATIPNFIMTIGDRAFDGSVSLTTVTFKSKPTYIGSAFTTCPNLTTINVPWSEGEVADAPWGAYNATINYNHTEG